MTTTRKLLDSHSGVGPPLLPSPPFPSALLTPPCTTVPLPPLHAISLYTTMATRRTISNHLSGSGSIPERHFATSKASGMGVKLSTFKVGSASQHTPAYPNDSQIPLDVRVQREEHVSFDVALDEEGSLEGKARRI